MTEPDIPGVPFRELEAFRNEFATSVHTCRLRACPRATVGFESQGLRIEHEMSHVRRYPCTRLGCQYPPFLTSTRLKSHVKRDHDTATPVRPIRRVKQAPTVVGPPIKERRTFPELDQEKKDMQVERLQSKGSSGVEVSQQPEAQSLQLPLSNVSPFTPEQVAYMTPEARQRYEAILKDKNEPPAMARFRTICQEELKLFEAQRFPEVVMTVDTWNQMAIGIGKILQEINKYAQAIKPWFRATGDEARLRAFLKTACSQLLLLLADIYTN